MLLMVGTEAAIKRTSPFHWRLKLIRVFRRLVVIPDAFVVLDVGGNQDPAHTVLRAPFFHPYLSVLEDNLGIHPSQAFRAKGTGVVVVGIVSNWQWAAFSV